jgi:antitoxin HicB
MYCVNLTLDDNGTILVTCPDLPEVTTFGEDEEDAIGRAADAVEEALAARIARREDIPTPSALPRLKILKALAASWTACGDVPLPLATPGQAIEEAIALLQHEIGIREPLRLPPLTVAKVELYRALRAGGISKAELGRRLGWHGPQVDRLFDLNHRSSIEHLDLALRAIGKRLDVSVEDAA